jgi:hypothetical protein
MAAVTSVAVAPRDPMRASSAFEMTTKPQIAATQVEAMDVAKTMSLRSRNLDKLPLRRASFCANTVPIMGKGRTPKVLNPQQCQDRFFGCCCTLGEISPFWGIDAQDSASRARITPRIRNTQGPEAREKARVRPQMSVFLNIGSGIARITIMISRQIGRT